MSHPVNECSAEWGLRRWKRRGKPEELFNQNARVDGKQRWEGED